MRWHLGARSCSSGVTLVSSAGEMPRTMAPLHVVATCNQGLHATKGAAPTTAGFCRARPASPASRPPLRPGRPAAQLDVGNHAQHAVPHFTPAIHHRQHDDQGPLPQRDAQDDTPEMKLIAFKPPPCRLLRSASRPSARRATSGDGGGPPGLSAALNSQRPAGHGLGGWPPPETRLGHRR